MSVDRSVANLDGQVALPRKNGELVFQAPWEGRAFGLAVVMSEKGQYEWDEFRSRLVEQVSNGGDSYYVSWLTALEGVLLATGIVTTDEIAARAAEYLALERDPVF